MLISGYPAPGWTQLGLCHHQLYSRAAQWAATVGLGGPDPWGFPGKAVEMDGLDGWIDWMDMALF